MVLGSGRLLPIVEFLMLLNLPVTIIVKTKNPDISLGALCIGRHVHLEIECYTTDFIEPEGTW